VNAAAASGGQHCVLPVSVPAATAPAVPHHPPVAGGPLPPQAIRASAP